MSTSIPAGPARRSRSMKRAALVAGAAAALAAGSAAIAPSAFASGTLANGFTAKVVAQSGQTISGPINATGYDLGIYIGPGVHHVRVIGARVTGANDEGILVQDTHDVLIENSTVSGNTQHPAQDLHHPGQNLQELKAISLTGTHHVVVSGNTVTGNGDGGIGVYDDGPNSSQINAPVAIDSNGVPSFGNVVFGNVVKDNLNGCGIVVSAKNPGGGVRNNLVAHNTVLGFDPATNDMNPGVGGIVVAGGSLGAVSVDRNVVEGNTITGGFIPGISLHASAPGQVTRTALVENLLTRNGVGAGGQTEGIEILTATAGAIDRTQVVRDRVVDDYYGVFHAGDTRTDIDGLQTSGVTVPVGP